MNSRTHEQTINSALGEVLEGLGSGWRVQSEQVGLLEGGGRVDILIDKQGEWPIVIEAEVSNYQQAETEARSRLGRRLSSSGRYIDTAIALVYPRSLREYRSAELRQRLKEEAFEYSLFFQSFGGNDVRLPERGWIKGGVKDLAVLLHKANIATSRVEDLAMTLEAGVTRAEGRLTENHPQGSGLGQEIAALLGQSDDEAGQTRKMAMTVLADALIFHEALAEAEMQVPNLPELTQRPVRSPQASRSNGSFNPSSITDEWERILHVNYWPIFSTARQIVVTLPTATATQVLNLLWEAAEQLVAGGVTRSHDLTGIVFQRLIADRQFLKTFYTRPAAASLLSALALPLERPIKGTDWGDSRQIGTARVGDFACGTGTLLSTAYQRIGLLHEVHGGNPKDMHPRMMERGLVGLDVLNIAVHLTAAMLAGSYPDTPFAGECLLTMPYGRHQWGVCLGSLDLMSPQISIESMQAAAFTAGGRGEEQVTELLAMVGHDQFNLIIMNPPFVRHGAREGDELQIHNPAFAAFEADETLQDDLASHLRRISRRGYGHGHAGLASYFVDLANRKLDLGGTMAMVLPLSAISGGSWEKIRELWRTCYSSLVVVTISEAGGQARSFSADTGIAECLVLGQKTRPDSRGNRGSFVVLFRQPQSTLDGELMGQAINSALADGEVMRLEDGPFHGTRLTIGDSEFGEIVDCPIPEDGPWQVAGIQDMSLAQTAYQLENSALWVEGMTRPHVLPIARLGETGASVGPHHLDISGSAIKSDGLPQGPFEVLRGCPEGSAYPSLWNHDCRRERRFQVDPDSNCRLRTVNGRIPEALQARAALRWDTASRCHYNTDFQFNSQSLLVAFTELPSLGGRAWPSIRFSNPSHDFVFVLWCNSTLGLMCHWWMSNKSQSGRGSITKTSIPLLPVLDFAALSDEQINNARECCLRLSHQRLLPFNQINEDPVRAELDRLFFEQVMGLPADFCSPNGPMVRLRAKLAREPQIDGNKQTRIVFEGDHENEIPR